LNCNILTLLGNRRCVLNARKIILSYFGRRSCYSCKKFRTEFTENRVSFLETIAVEASIRKLKDTEIFFFSSVCSV
jgi:hypothetical protein